MLYVSLHLSESIRYRVCNIYLISWIHESIVEAHSPIGPLLLGVEVVDLFLVGGLLVCDILTALLHPAALTLL